MSEKRIDYTVRASPEMVTAVNLLEQSKAERDRLRGELEQWRDIGRGMVDRALVAHDAGFGETRMVCHACFPVYGRHRRDCLIGAVEKLLEVADDPAESIQAGNIAQSGCRIEVAYPRWQEPRR